jgi:hypothetical protein
MEPMSHRVVITDIGAITAIGSGKEELWRWPNTNTSCSCVRASAR